MLNRIRLIAALALFACVTSRCAAEEPSFEQHVRPILKAYCFDCHGDAEKLEGNLDLRLKRKIAAGGESGPAIVAGKPAESLVYARIKSGEMPPREKKVRADSPIRISESRPIASISTRPTFTRERSIPVRT